MSHLLLSTIVGSRAHGMATAQSDVDCRGIFVLPPADLLSPFEAPTAQPIANGTAWELRHYLRLVLKQDVRALEVLFVDPAQHTMIAPAGRRLLAMRDRFLSRRLAPAFAGQASQCMDNISASHVRTGRLSECQELGWDTKDGVHGLRILMTGLEVMTHGVFRVKRPDGERLFLQDVRAGSVSRERVLAEMRRLRAELLAAGEANTSLPVMVERDLLVELALELTELAWLSSAYEGIPAPEKSLRPT